MISMRTAIVILFMPFATNALATLPPPTDEAKASAAVVAAKSAWADKIGLYKLCMAMDRTAESYRSDLKASGSSIPAPVPTPSCVDPGPYAPQAQITPATSKPLEAAGAHSPPGTAISPPSTRTPAAVGARTDKP